MSSYQPHLQHSSSPEKDGSSWGRSASHRIRARQSPTRSHRMDSQYSSRRENQPSVNVQYNEHNREREEGRTAGRDTHQTWSKKERGRYQTGSRASRVEAWYLSSIAVVDVDIYTPGQELKRHYGSLLPFSLVFSLVVSVLGDGHGACFGRGRLFLSLYDAIRCETKRYQFA